MKNVIVASFKEESKAIDALHKLTELDVFGDILIYEQVMVRKNEDGKTEILRQDDSEGWRTLTGMGVGSLLGLVGGPVGFLVGLYTGAAVGVVAEADYYDFAEDFIAKVEKKMEVGTVAIIAEIEEDSAVFVDSSLKPFGAVIWRSDFDLEFDKHDDEEIDEIEAEIAEERAALKKAVGDDKKKIETNISKLKEKRRASIAGFKAKGKQGFEKIKSDIASVGTKISEEMKREKMERLNRRIGRHKSKLNELDSQLNELDE